MRANTLYQGDGDSILFPIAIMVEAQLSGVSAVQNRSHHGGELISSAHFSMCSTLLCDALHNSNSADRSIFGDAPCMPELASLVEGFSVTVFGASGYMQHSKIHVSGHSSGRLFSPSFFVSLVC